MVIVDDGLSGREEDGEIEMGGRDEGEEGTLISRLCFCGSSSSLSN